MSGTSKLEDYLHSTEGARLEFKRSAAIEDDKILPRAVCGFANTDGGEIVVGIAETARGLEPDPFPDFERAHRVVLDRLVERLEPVPAFTIERLESAGGGSGMRIRVEKSSKLHALHGKGGFKVWKRIGDRMRELTWAEIGAHFGTPFSSSGAVDVEQRLSGWRSHAPWTRLAPRLLQQGGLLFAGRLGEPRDDGTRLNQDLTRAWMERPAELGLDATTFGYATRGGEIVHEEQDWFRSGSVEEAYRVLRVSRFGEVEFASCLQPELATRQQTLDELFGGEDSRLLGKRSVPYVVLKSSPFLQTLQSLVRLQLALDRELERLTPSRSHDKVHLALALVGCRDLRLEGRRARVDPRGGNADSDPFPSDETTPLVASLSLNEALGQRLELDGGDRLAHTLARKLFELFLDDDGEIPYWNADLARFDFGRAGA